MKLRWKEFERRVRGPLRARIAQSPTDLREYRRHGLWQKLTQTVHLPAWTARIFLLPVAGAVFAGLTLRPGRRNASMLVSAILVWMALSVIWRLAQLTVALQTSSRLLVFGHLPMSDTEIFDQQWKAYLWTMIGSVLDFALLYFLLALAAGCGRTSLWIGAVLALAQGLVVLAAVVGFVAWFWNRKFMGPTLRILSFSKLDLPSNKRLLAAGKLLLVVVAISLLGYGLRGVAGWAVVVPPLGLAHEGLGFGKPGSLLARSWTAFSLATIMMLLPLAYRRLRATYRLPEGLVAGERERGEVEAVRRGEVSDDTADPCAHIKAAIRRREFLQEASWRRAGWLEGFTGRWLTKPERTAAEFLLAGTPGWTRLFKRVLVAAVVCAIGWYLVPAVFRVAGFLVPFLAFAIAARSNHDLVWPGARTRTVSGSSIAMYAVYPIGFWGIARINLKMRLAHLGLLLAALGVAGAVLLVRQDLWLNSARGYYAGLILLFVLSLIGLAPLLQVSSGTNDASKLWIILLVVPLVAVVFIGLTAAMVLARGGWAYLAGTGLLLSSYSALLLYGHAYNRGWFDAQKKPQTSSSFKLSRSQ